MSKIRVSEPLNVVKRSWSQTRCSGIASASGNLITKPWPKYAKPFLNRDELMSPVLQSSMKLSKNSISEPRGICSNQNFVFERLIHCSPAPIQQHRGLGSRFCTIYWATVGFTSLKLRALELSKLGIYLLRPLGWRFDGSDNTHLRYNRETRDTCRAPLKDMRALAYTVLVSVYITRLYNLFLTLLAY
jgi:hypothetical protein